MKTEHLAYFLEVVRCRSINQASKQLHLNHQYLSQIITGLEKELGVRLLERTRVGVALTAEGRQALPRIEAIVEEVRGLREVLDAAAERTRQSLRGTFSLYCISSIEPGNIAQVVQDMQSVYPGINLIMKECSNQEALNAVCQDQHSIGQLLLSQQVPALWPELPESVELVVLQEKAIAAWVSSSSPLLQMYDSITLKSVLKYNVVLYSSGDKEDSPPYRILQSVSAGEPVIKCVTSNLNTFYKMLGHENAITLGTRRTFSENKEVTMIPIRDNIKVLVALAVHKAAQEMPFVQEFIKRCQELYQT